MSQKNCPNCAHVVVDHTDSGCAHCDCPLDKQAAMRSLAVAAAILDTRD